MTREPQPARVLFATLTERVSARGSTYLRGWAGASNLVGFEAEPDEEGRRVWNLYLTERQAPRPQAALPFNRRPRNCAAIDNPAELAAE